MGVLFTDTKTHRFCFQFKNLRSNDYYAMKEKIVSYCINRNNMNNMNNTELSLHSGNMFNAIYRGMGEVVIS